MTTPAVVHSRYHDCTWVPLSQFVSIARSWERALPAPRRGGPRINKQASGCYQTARYIISVLTMSILTKQCLLRESR